MWFSSYQIAIQRLSTKPTSCWFDGKSHPLRRLGERLWLRKRLHQTNHSGQIIATSHDQRLLPRKLRKGNLFISGESRWVKYFNLASESLEMLKFNSQTRKKDKGFSPKNLLPRRKRKSFSKTKIFPPPTPSTKKNTRCVCVCGLFHLKIATVNFAAGVLSKPKEAFRRKLWMCTSGIPSSHSAAEGRVHGMAKEVANGVRAWQVGPGLVGFYIASLRWWGKIEVGRSCQGFQRCSCMQWFLTLMPILNHIYILLYCN